MIFSLNTILTALIPYSFNNSSTRAISQLPIVTSNIKMYHVTISSWTNKFAPFFKAKAEKFKNCSDIQSDDCHTNKTVIFINCEHYYMWIAIDSETKFILAFHLIKSHNGESAFTFINEAKKFGTPYNFITDRLLSYD